MEIHSNKMIYISCCRYTRGGLIEQAFYIQIANAILPEVTDLLNPFAFLTSHILARYVAHPGSRLRV